MCSEICHATEVSDHDLMGLLETAASQVRPDSSSNDAWHDRYFKNHKHRLSEDLRQCVRLLKRSDAVLEIGSVPLLLTTALKTLGFQVTGIDIDPSRYQVTIDRLGLCVKRCNIEMDPLPLKDKSADVVIMNEVFEHLRIDLNYTFDQISRVLRPGGVLLMSTPNLYSYRGIKNFLFRQQAAVVCPDIHREYGKIRALGHMGHVREYTPHEVKHFLSNFGLEVEDTIFRGAHGKRMERAVVRMFPRLKRFITVVARKNEE